MQTFSVKDFFYSWIILFVVWLGFTATLDIYEVLTGLLVSLVIAYYTYKNYSHKGLNILMPNKIFYTLKYLLVFLRALVVANFDVARRVVSPKLPINPGIVKFESQLQSDFAKMVLANSITLTPGTLTVDMVENTFYIHWIDVTTTDPGEAFTAIAKDFEEILIKIFDK